MTVFTWLKGGGWIVANPGELPLPASNQEPDRVRSHTTRIVRETLASEAVKKAHQHVCQACSARIELPGGAYAQAVYIRPLGRPHNGPDTADNILCLCPNCHVLFDGWAFAIEDDGTIIGALSGTLNEIEAHDVNREHLAYHRHMYFEVAGARKHT